MITAIGFVVAAGVGAVVRFGVRAVVPSDPFPWATLAVNLTGSLALGLLAGWQPPGATVVGVAGLGALTTFSTFAAEVVALAERHRALLAAYVGTSVVGGVALAWTGLHLAGA